MGIITMRRDDPVHLHGDAVAEVPGTFPTRKGISQVIRLKQSGFFRKALAPFFETEPGSIANIDLGQIFTGLGLNADCSTDDLARLERTRQRAGVDRADITPACEMHGDAARLAAPAIHQRVT